MMFCSIYKREYRIALLCIYFVHLHSLRYIYQLFKLCDFSLLLVLANFQFCAFFYFQFCPIFNFVQFSILSNFQFFNFVQFSFLFNFRFRQIYVKFSRALFSMFQSCFVGEGFETIDKLTYVDVQL